jgi:hypothetical protein
MCCPHPRELGLEAVMAITHACWVIGWFCAGHLISMPVFNCRAGWSNCNFVEPFGVGLALVGSILYFFILRHVANFLYKRELPGGEELTYDMKKSLASILSGQGIDVRHKKGKK